MYVFIDYDNSYFLTLLYVGGTYTLGWEEGQRPPPYTGVYTHTEK